ncbi:YcbK family protein [Undibacterium sp. Ji42W]|uniref:YcbK family protein n=1 Tax=Undibacterium sp. Ji42W TaxID=3413039 RepID=UPI003BF5CFEA
MHMHKSPAKLETSTAQSPRRDFLAKSFAVAAGLILPATVGAANVAAGQLFRPDYYYPEKPGEGGILRRIYLTREASKWHPAERADFLLWGKDGRIDAEGYKRLCWFLRDVRSSRVVQVDMRLAALITAVQSHFWFHQGIHGYYHLTSGYRSWVTNDQTEGAAADSGHVYAGAADGWLDGVSVEDLAGAALSLRAGGVGLYKKRGFVHTDVVGKPNLWKA